MGFCFKKKKDCICKFWRYRISECGVKWGKTSYKRFQTRDPWWGKSCWFCLKSVLVRLGPICALHSPMHPQHPVEWLMLLKICWMSECLVCWDNSVASGFGGTDSLGIPERLGLSSLQISSLSALRFLLLLWEIVCVLLPVHQTQFNELFLFSCLPTRSHFLFLKIFMLQAHWLGNFNC